MAAAGFRSSTGALLEPLEQEFGDVVIKIGTAGEVAKTIVFLASDYSTYMTGEIVSVSSQHP